MHTGEKSACRWWEPNPDSSVIESVSYIKRPHSVQLIIYLATFCYRTIKFCDLFQEVTAVNMSSLLHCASAVVTAAGELCSMELEAIREYAQTFIARPQYQARLGLYLFESLSLSRFILHRVSQNKRRLCIEYMSTHSAAISDYRIMLGCGKHKICLRTYVCNALKIIFTNFS
jgi:hypothetical protein